MGPLFTHRNKQHPAPQQKPIAHSPEVSRDRQDGDDPGEVNEVMMGGIMITNSKQVWAVGETVKVGFLSLRITATEKTPGDFRPDKYHLTDASGKKKYTFTPHFGLERVQ